MISEIKNKISISKEHIEKLSKAKGGHNTSQYPLGWNKTFKEQIRNRDGYKCQLCGVPEVECNRKLHVYHIDYNKQNMNPDNLISLCMSCHIRTNVKKENRDYWIKIFENSRNQNVSYKL